MVQQVKKHIARPEELQSDPEATWWEERVIAKCVLEPPTWSVWVNLHTHTHTHTNWKIMAEEFRNAEHCHKINQPTNKQTTKPNNFISHASLRWWPKLKMSHS